jgi:NhaA family Na+:H+ antiporter
MRVVIDFFRHDAAVGIILLVAAVSALILDNSPLAYIYDQLLTTPVTVAIGAASIDKPLLLWINDGLMAVFFFLVGLEIKHEVLEGQLSTPAKAALPAVAAIGGMAAPALIYVAFNAGDPAAINGWAIPAATDIAFALGLLALVGSGVPIALKIFLLALAIIDDLGAIIIIAVFYTENLSIMALTLGAAGSAVLFVFNRLKIMSMTPYILVGTVIWVCVLKSGVHATLAGVVIALMIPLRGEDAPLERVEHALHPWVYFFIMPVFAFANAGVSLSGIGLETYLQPITLGIALGLIIGKPLGIVGLIFIAERMKMVSLPEGIGWKAITGVACLAGVGFTMSLFIGTLAFADPANATYVRIGVLSGSTVSGILGVVLLNIALKRMKADANAKTVAAT